ncbi:PREDICTED: natural cytotoxicity triggering receptor 3 ligand 1, partial [Elephantulus edwardii]|uniref:natural cytotoxicity triggering receptor 3 ligand 1 n=1 Tax=Elephantulus edwardii TaxID=28737 RepID=UPI0003F09858
AGFLEVEMAGSTQVVTLNANATIFCKIRGYSHLDIKIMGISWYFLKHNSSKEVQLFQFYSNLEKNRREATVSLRDLARGNASLQLPWVQLEDAGRYRCEVVVTPEKAQGSVSLEVVAYPVSSLLPERAVVKINEEVTLECESHRFYPESINITWVKMTQTDPHAVEISEDVISSHTVKNKDGTLNTTNYLKFKPSLDDNGNIYQCVIRHKLLLTPVRFNFTLTVIKPEKGNMMIVVVSVTILAVILLGVLAIKTISRSLGMEAGHGVGYKSSECHKLEMSRGLGHF